MTEITAEERRELLVQEVLHLCEELNKAGADPLWTPVQLHLYINEKFEVMYGLDSMSGLSFAALKLDLSSKLDQLRAADVSAA